MTQTASIITRTGTIQVEVPSPTSRLLDEVKWGAIDEFPSPAYWRFQVVAQRLSRQPPTYRLGRTLCEEVAACLLGGHGIPASVGLAAFMALRSRGAFAEAIPSTAILESWLREPLKVGDRLVHYRFAAQKARYLAASLPRVTAAPQFESGRELRDWLLDLPGVGPKTASWIARNWLGADDVAILDIHIVRVCQFIGVFPRNLTVEKDYVELEELFLRYSDALEVRPSELDAIIWYEMASSRMVSRAITENLLNANGPTRKTVADPVVRRTNVVIR